MSRVLRSLEGKKRYKKRLLVSAVVVLIFLCATVAGLSWVSSLPALSITEVVVEGHETLPALEIKEKSQAFLSGKYYYLFSRANAFLYPKSILMRKLQQEYPRAESISLSLEGLNTLVVTVEERKGEYLWCGAEAPSIASPSQCLFLDNNGFAFDTAPTLGGDIRLAFYGGTQGEVGASTTPPVFAVGEIFSEPEEFRTLLKFVDEVKKFEATPVKIFKGSENYAEIYMKEGWKLVFHADADFQKFAGNFQAIAKAPEWNIAVKGEKTKDGTLEYLDFRFGNKVYYRFEK